MLLKWSFQPKHHKKKSNFLFSTSSFKSLSKSSKTLYHVEIRRLVKWTVEQFWLQLVVFCRMNGNMPMILIWSLQLIWWNKSISWRIEAVFKKFREYHKMCPLSLLHQKQHTWFELGKKQIGVRNSSNFLKWSFQPKKKIKQIEFHRFHSFV